MKISTSPGELRLNRDLEEAAASGLGRAVGGVGDGPVWIPVDPTDPNRGGWADPTALDPLPFAPVAGPTHGGASTVHPSTSGAASQHTTPPLELRSSDGRSVLRRDPVDPLRLRLSVLVPMASARGTGNGAPLNKENCECWTYLLQIPRMYPHSPPIVARITRSAPHQNQATGAPTLLPSFVLAAYGRDNDVEPPPLDRVVVKVTPPLSSPRSNGCLNQNQQSKSEESTEQADLDWQDDAEDWSEAIFDGWSPVSSLSDLLVFLVNLPLQRRGRWQVARRTKSGRPRRHRGQQEHKDNDGTQQRRRQEGQGDAVNGSGGRFRRQVSMTPYDDLDENTDFVGSSGMDNDDVIGRPQPQAADEERDDDMTVSSTSSQGRSQPQDRPGSDAAKHALLPPNRFDVGYDRHVNGNVLSGNVDPRNISDGVGMDQGFAENGFSGIPHPPTEVAASESSASLQPPHPVFAGWPSSTSAIGSGFHANGGMVRGTAGGGAEGDAGAGRVRSFEQIAFNHSDGDQQMMMD